MATVIRGPAPASRFTGRAGDNSYDLTLSRINTIDDDSAGNGIRFHQRARPADSDRCTHRRGAEKVGYGLERVAVAAGLARRLHHQSHLAADHLQQRRVL